MKEKKRKKRNLIKKKITKKKEDFKGIDGFTWKRQEGSDLMDTRMMEFRRGF